MLAEWVLMVFGWIAEVVLEFLIDTAFGVIFDVVLWPLRKVMESVAPWTGG